MASSLWILFMVWTAIVAAVWFSGWGAPLHEDGPVSHAELKATLAFALRVLDPIWILLAAANLYLNLAGSEGLSSTRRWVAIVLLVSLGISVLSLLTGIPLGPISFPRRLGVQLFGVPFGVPLLWLIIVAGGREIVSRLLPKASHLQVALLTGLLAAGSAWMMEPIAREDRAWWLWREGRNVVSAPVQNFLTWGFGSAALAFLFRPRMAPFATGERWKIPTTWMAVHVVFLMRHIARLLS